jgi:hypothetical protein
VNDHWMAEFVAAGCKIAQVALVTWAEKRTDTTRKWVVSAVRVLTVVVECVERGR